eukprot:CAMPEP_0184382430 /NCGR_PEP_ID=MMETSP0007-20130409/6334_1 /TAXON_ID=97485 /ORGANISM="Prymnesium parvum, Strain Texoma1" /LENGTH=50 /DNA_ID=CAMNT_0026728475 /DNA_START=292 /DNA_END=440 /DNA_ORIENTATION=-
MGAADSQRCGASRLRSDVAALQAALTALPALRWLTSKPAYVRPPPAVVCA